MDLLLVYADLFLHAVTLNSPLQSVMVTVPRSLTVVCFTQGDVSKGVGGGSQAALDLPDDLPNG